MWLREGLGAAGVEVAVEQETPGAAVAAAEAAAAAAVVKLKQLPAEPVGTAGTVQTDLGLVAA